MVELQEEIFGDHFVPEVGVIRGRITAEVSEGGPQVGFGEWSEEGIAAQVVERDGVEVDRLGLGFVNVVRDGGEGILTSGPEAATEGGGAVHADYEVSGDGFASFVVMSEFGEDLRAAKPFLEHLRRSFDEIGFHCNAADAGPLLLASQDVMH